MPKPPRPRQVLIAYWSILVPSGSSGGSCSFIATSPKPSPTPAATADVAVQSLAHQAMAISHEVKAKPLNAEIRQPRA